MARFVRVFQRNVYDYFLSGSIKEILMQKVLKRLLIASAVSATLGVVGLQPASAMQLVSNGGFETGDLTGWTTSGIAGAGPCPSANKDWNVSNNGAATGCNAVANPSGSTYAAYVMNDGTGPLTYKLFQSIFVPLGTVSGQLTFDWTTVNFSDAGRQLNALLNGATVFSSSTFGSTGWTPQSVDVSGILSAAAGTSITLEFDNFIPQTWSGPAGLGLDNVSLENVVPEPASLALLGLGLAGLGFSRRKKA
jgi:hypothetical protein